VVCKIVLDFYCVFVFLLTILTFLAVAQVFLNNGYHYGAVAAGLYNKGMRDTDAYPEKCVIF